MPPAPTISRIFADRYRREATRLERLHANHLAPGTATWGDAMTAMEARLAKLPGPVKRSAAMRKAGDYLSSAQDDGMHFMLGRYFKKRSSILSFATINFGSHPLMGVSEDGVHIARHAVLCRRDGSGGTKTNISLGYVSRHAVQRLHERGQELSIKTATNMFTCIGLLGHLIGHGHGHAHVDCEMSLCIEDMLATGVIRGAVGSDGESGCIFFEVRTFLPVADIDNRPAKLRQGEIAWETLGDWIGSDRSRETSEKMLARIPTLPWREDDFVQQTAVKRTKASA